MEYRFLGASGLKIPVMALGTAGFGGGDEAFRKWGEVGVKDATRLVDICLEAGLTLFDSADAYSKGLAEEILGEAIAGRRHQLLLSTKTGMRMAEGPNEVGTSRERIIRACEASLRRLRTEYIDIYHLHMFDAFTPVEDTLSAIDALVHAGKVRYFAVSNYSGWHLMKMLATAGRLGLPRPIAHQAYYSLAAREFEWELMPLALDQRIGTLVWSPLAGARLTGKIRRGMSAPAGTRAVTDVNGPSIPTEHLYRLIDALDTIASDTGMTIPQVVLAWTLSRPTVSGLVIGARDEKQLRDNLGVIGKTLDSLHIAALDAASDQAPIYPYWHQRLVSSERNPPPI